MYVPPQLRNNDKKHEFQQQIRDKLRPNASASASEENMDSNSENSFDSDGEDYDFDYSDSESEYTPSYEKIILNMDELKKFDDILLNDELLIDAIKNENVQQIMTYLNKIKSFNYWSSLVKLIIKINIKFIPKLIHDVPFLLILINLFKILDKSTIINLLDNLSDDMKDYIIMQIDNDKELLLLFLNNCSFEFLRDKLEDARTINKFKLYLRLLLNFKKKLQNRKNMLDIYNIINHLNLPSDKNNQIKIELLTYFFLKVGLIPEQYIKTGIQKKAFQNAISVFSVMPQILNSDTINNITDFIPNKNFNIGKRSLKKYSR